MPEQPIRRRLAAILAADVASYSSMMGADEAGTIAAELVAAQPGFTVSSWRKTQFRSDAELLAAGVPEQ
jgi:hypothetical protein